MESVEFNYLRGVTEKLLESPLSYAFANPIDPNEDWAPAYFEVIKHPMDISTVLKKLNARKYSSPKEWYADISLIWDNAVTFNGKQSFLYPIVQELRTKCDRKYAKMPKTEQERLMAKLSRAQKAMNALLSFDLPPHSLVPAVDPEEMQYNPNM